MAIEDNVAQVLNSHLQFTADNIFEFCFMFKKPNKPSYLGDSLQAGLHIKNQALLFLNFKNDNTKYVLCYGHDRHFIG